MPRWIKFINSSLSQCVSDEVKHALLVGGEQITDKSSPVSKASWVHDVMVRIDSTVDDHTRRTVLENCGRQCIGKSLLRKVVQLKNSSPSLIDFLNRLNQQHIGGGHLIYIGNGVIDAEYERCYCGMVSQSKVVISSTYCNCSRGWFKELFETAFTTKVEVELMHSIVQGAQKCQFRIILPETEVW